MNFVFGSILGVYLLLWLVLKWLDYLWYRSDNESPYRDEKL